MASISFVAKTPPQVVLPALTLAVGLWFIIFGVLGLGFLFDLIPVFFCIALVTAFAIITLTLQVPILLGLLAVPPNFTTLVPDLLKNLGNLSGRTVAISVSALVFLAALRAVYRKWGAESTIRGKASQLGVATAGLLAIVIYTGVSSAFLSSLPLQQQLAPFTPPVSMDPGAPFAAAGGGIPPQAGLGGVPPQAAQAAVGSSSTTLQAGVSSTQMSRSNSTTTGSLALVDPMLRRAVAITARQSPPPPVTGNFSTMSASTEESGGRPPVPKLPFWSAFPLFNTTIPSTSPPNPQLVQGLFLPSLSIFLAINVEHIVVARFFAHEQGYTISKSQEMFSLGLINIANAFLGGVPVGGGDMARSSVLGFAGARSPLNQIFASCTVLLAMMPASGALRFLPQAALASITFLAIFDQMPPQALMNVYFQMSFADFLAFFIVLNGAIAAPPGIGGLAAVVVGVLYMILYTIFRGMFAGPKVIKSPDLEASRQKEPWVQYLVVEKDTIPASTLVVTSDVDLVWTNAERMHRHIMDAAFLYNSGIATEPLGKPELPWSMRTQKHIRSVRARHERKSKKPDAVIAFRPRLRMVILDLSKVAFVDTSGLMNLDLVKKQLRYWAGDEVEFRFVGLNKHLVRRFRRAKWPIMNPFDRKEEEDDESVMKDLVFSTLSQALRHKSQDVGMDSTFEQIIEDGMDISLDGFRSPIQYGTAM